MNAKRKRVIGGAAIAAAGLLAVAAWMGLTGMKEEGMESMQAGAIAHSSEGWAVVPEIREAPKLDGVLDESVWGQAAMLDGLAYAYTEQPLSYAAEYRLAYDSEYLYIGGQLDSDASGQLAQIELVLRPAGQYDKYFTAVIPVAPDPEPRLTTILNSADDSIDMGTDLGRRPLSSIRTQTRIEDGKWRLEAAIPLKDVAGSGVAAGEEWGFNVVHLHKLYTQPIASWIPIRQTNHWDTPNAANARVDISLIDQDRMGRVVFGETAVGMAGQSAGSASVRKWTPAQTELSYIGFTTKSLALKRDEGMPGEAELELLWKAPHEEWQLLKTERAKADKTMYRMQFEHPEPLEDGIYQLRVQASAKSGDDKWVSTLVFDREAAIAAGEKLWREASGDDRGERAAENARQIAPSDPSELVRQTMELIPPQPGFRYVGLPEMPELYPDSLYTLSGDGKSLIATRTGTVYPNDRFKEDRTLAVENGKGELVTIPYHEDEKGNRYFITGHLWNLQKQRAMTQTATVAKSDPLGAARLLYAWTQAYETYNPTVDRVSGGAYDSYSAKKASGPPHPYWGGIWNRWWLNDLPQFGRLLEAYQAVKQTNAFEVLSAEIGEDVERRVLQNMILPSSDYVDTYIVRFSNMIFQPWLGWAALGKALEEPDYIHRVVELTERMVTRMFLSDGYWKEVSNSYHIQTVRALGALMERLKGWSDPPGYVSPRTGKRLDDLNMEQDYPEIARVFEVADKFIYPNGNYVPITDTWPNDRPAKPSFQGSFLLPSAGVARLAGGKGFGQTQLYMGFQPRNGHDHYDPLNLSLYAAGQELLPDIGYTHNTKYRYFAVSTLGHNTVVVDGANMRGGDATRFGGRIEAYVPEGGLFAAMRASYPGAYAQTSQYSREPWFVPFADGDGAAGYMLDLFRVSGGSRHEYTLNGDANRDVVFETDAPLSDYGPYLLPPGTKTREASGVGDSGNADGHYPAYLYVRDVRQAELSGESYTVNLRAETAPQDQSGMRITGLLEPGDNALYLGRSPSLRAGRLNGISKDNNDEADKYSMPKLVHRREGVELDSTFVTLLEPYGKGDAPRVEEVRRITPDQAPPGAVAVQIRYGTTTDWLVSNPLHPDQPVIIGDLTLQGEMGLVRQSAAGTQLALVGGTAIRKGGQELAGTGSVTGAVIGTLRKSAGDGQDALIVKEAVPDEATGTYVVVTHPDDSTHGFEIGEVVREDGRTLLVLREHDPGFVIGEDGRSQLTYFPRLQWEGEHRYRIMNVVGHSGT